MTPWAITTSTKTFCNNYVTLEIHKQREYIYPTQSMTKSGIRNLFKVNIYGNILTI